MNITIGVLFPDAFIKALLGILVLVVIDLGLGISVAIKTKSFEWKKIADFYQSKVLGNVLGWAIVDTVIRIAAFYQLPVVTDLQPIIEGGLLAAPMIALLAQIGTKIGAMREETPPVTGVKG